MSSFIGGRSGNRGECAQPCRQLYSFGKEKGYFLSPRDLCLANEVKEMCDAGITSFKIEGRMKSPEYVATVTSVYRKYLDSFSPFEKDDEEKLKKIFVRGDGFTKAYFAEKNTPEIMNYTLSNDNLSSRADEDALKDARQSFRDGVENKKIPVTATLTLRENSPAVLTLSDGIYSVQTEGDISERAKNLPLSYDRAFSQISKLGQTPYSLTEFSFDTDEVSTLSASSLNALRRDAADKLSVLRTKIQKKEIFPFSYPSKKAEKRFGRQYIAAEISSAEQYSFCKDADRILVPIDLWDSISPDEKCYVLLPPVVLDEEKVLKKLSSIPVSFGVYVSSLGMAELVRKSGHRVYFDQGANIYNAVSVNVSEAICDGVTFSPELSLSAIEQICKTTSLPCEAVCYGYQRVMTSRACLIRGIKGKCDCSSPVTIKDKTGAEFKISAHPDTHLNYVFNSRPTFTADKLKEFRKSGLCGLRLCFTFEDSSLVSDIISMYKGAIEPIKPPIFTRGYLFK